jgi:Phage Terminase
MPRRLVRAPGHDRGKSLGWLACAWIERLVRHGPGGVRGMRVAHGDEMTGFIVDCYAIGSKRMNNYMLYDSAFFSRPKGADKSGMGARLALFEAFGPCRYAGIASGGEIYRDPWGLGFSYTYEPGEPMGKHPQDPVIRIMATEEKQAGNTYDTIYVNLTDDDCPLSQIQGMSAGLTRVFLPGGGEIIPSTASSSSKDGGKETFVVFDESHLYNTAELRQMYDTVVRNLDKRKSQGTWFLETTTMYAPGENSVAEGTYAEAEALAEGRKVGEHRLLYDHRWGECDDLADEEKLRAALADAFGDAMGWNDIDSLVNGIRDTRRDPQASRRYFLNALTSSSDAWIAAHEWQACAAPTKFLKPKDMVCLGFDGSINDDSTALVACRVIDAHLQLLGVWEKPEGDLGLDWRVDTISVDAAVAEAFKTYDVVGFFADPAHWQSMLDKWHFEFAERLQVQASAARPLEWWTNRPKQMVHALETFYNAVRGHELSFTPAEDRAPGSREVALATTLTRHVLNARRRPSRMGLQIGKFAQHDKRKIDAAIAATLALSARNQAIANGVQPRSKTMYAARRIR